MGNTILHMDLDTFFVSVERLIDSHLEKKPILIGGTSERGVVASCSYETRAFGVHSGMPMRMARKLCPESIVIRGDMSNYSKYSSIVTDIVKERVPILEKSSIDEFYADLSGMDKFFGCYKYASEIRNTIIKESGLPISFGLSVNKTVSKVATGEAKPNNQMKIDFGTEKNFLAPLSVKKIPMIGNKTYQTLCNLGIKKVETIQQMPIEMLSSVFGKNGELIWKRSNGIDNRPVIAYNERKSISTERTFDKDTIDVAKLKTLIKAMVEGLAFQLRNEGKLTSCVAVKIRYSDFNTHTKQLKIPYTSADHILTPKITELFDALYNRRLLVRLIGIRFSGLIRGTYQLNLFEDNIAMFRLYKEIDLLKNRFGSKKIVKGSTIGEKSFGRRMNSFSGEEEGKKGKMQIGETINRDFKVK